MSVCVLRHFHLKPSSVLHYFLLAVLIVGCLFCLFVCLSVCFLAGGREGGGGGCQGARERGGDVFDLFHSTFTESFKGMVQVHVLEAIRHTAHLTASAGVVRVEMVAPPRWRRGLNRARGAWIAHLVVCWASLSGLMQHRGFNPPLGRIFPVEGIFPLELTGVQIPFPKTLSDESIN